MLVRMGEEMIIKMDTIEIPQPLEDILIPCDDCGDDFPSYYGEATCENCRKHPGFLKDWDEHEDSRR